MPFGSLFFGIAVFWILVHAANKVYLSRSQGPTLPGFVPRRRRTGNTIITIDRLHLRVQTNYLNDVHNLFAQWSLKNPRLRQVLSGFYDLGTTACCVGALTALGLLLWTTWGLFATVVFYSASGDPVLATSHLAKRDFIPPEPSTSTATSSFGVRPLVRKPYDPTESFSNLHTQDPRRHCAHEPSTPDALRRSRRADCARNGTRCRLCTVRLSFLRRLSRLTKTVGGLRTNEGDQLLD